MGAYHEGYIYWPELLVWNDSAVRIRRMSTTAPYPVETYWLPPGIAGGSAIDTNPATGRPYAVEMDWMGGSSGPTAYGLAFEGDWFYLLQNDSQWDNYHGDVEPPTADGGAYMALYRAPVADPSQWELLYWGWDAFNQGAYPRDATTEYSSVAPYIVPPGYLYLTPGFENPVWPATGTPDLEGFDPAAVPVISNGSLFFQNWTTAYIQIMLHGLTLCRFDLPRLVADVQANGPIRHNQQAPYYETIANGTAGDEGFVGYNYNNRQRGFQYRSGNVPLLTHAAGAGLCTAPSSERFAGSLLYPSPSLSSFGPAIAFNLDTWCNWMICELTPVDQTPSSAAIDVRLRFDGLEMRGYGPQYPLTVQPPPEEVILS
jgi:hypothetical protein